MSKILTNITKRVGDYIASKTKDADNELFAEISETVIDEFINEIKKDNPVLASWVEDWKKKKIDKPVKKITSVSHDCDSDSGVGQGGCGFTSTYKFNGGCGWTPRYKQIGGSRGSSAIRYDGGC